MLVFDVLVNGELQCTAGLDGPCVLTSILTFVRSAEDKDNDCSLVVGGLDSAAHEHLTWLEQKLKVGDQVTITVADREQADPPTLRKKDDPQFDLERQQAYVLEMARSFGWTVHK